MERLPHGAPPAPDDEDMDEVKDMHAEKESNTDENKEPVHTVNLEAKEFEQTSGLLSRLAEKSLEASCKKVVGKALQPFQATKH